ncbi:hypothetical protein SGODD07_00464 [Streptococcus gordonii]|uniref:Uncharacterized protein n=1 Tax=Streptococcus gordonii TaxID=1302 RepID=A0A139NB97_STRGN|nr:hypothetical protein SGODD07_00464 [Streptococcus gordonii]
MPRIPSLQIGDFSMSLREARPLVEAELREIDADTVGVESAIALDEMNSQEEVGSNKTYLRSEIIQY